MENSTTTRLGKIRGIQMPPERSLYLFLQKVENPLPSWHSDTPIRQWAGVDCTEDGQVLSLQWNAHDLRGSFQWEHIPASVIRIYLCRNEISGEVVFRYLPRSLQELWLIRNKLTGRVVVEDFPESLLSVSLAHNNFSGEVNFLSLPPHLCYIDVSFNYELMGDLFLATLPCSVDSWCTKDTQIVVHPKK